MHVGGDDHAKTATVKTITRIFRRSTVRSVVFVVYSLDENSQGIEPLSEIANRRRTAKFPKVTPKKKAIIRLCSWAHLLVILYIACTIFRNAFLFERSVLFVYDCGKPK